MHKSSQNRINHPAIFVGIHQQENLTCFDPSPYYVFQKHFSGIETWKKKQIWLLPTCLRKMGDLLELGV